MAVILFDGVCNLCTRSVRFVIARDRVGYFRFASLSSRAAARLLRSSGPAGALPDSLVLIEDGAVFTRSDAVLRVARRLSFPWPLAYAFVVLPKSLRDRVYDAIARRRYRWFGRREVCEVPAPVVRRRFLDDGV